MQPIEGIYQNGVIVALEPLELNEGDKVKIFVPRRHAQMQKTLNAEQTLVGTLEILDEDLEAASLEIREKFLRAIEKSGEEFQK